MFVWSATLITPIIAIILVNSWKTQKKFEIEKEYASLVLNDIHPILIRIIDLQSMYLNIKDINQNLVLYEKYTIQSDLQIRTLNLKSFSNIKIFSKLTDNIEILNKYYSLDHHLIDLLRK
ncbi:hypothetical protein G9F31_15620 [Acinetobacter sp. 187]|uniref:hypothetical protein n=1 Tax=Acinetobacter lanii TaxID=2715163 RepID=UPI00140D1EB0|nr:hypothetical protein [Acinetobacter lanii]NHC05145.1 hypothetical protein [Acinetobacter lanii]